MCIYCLENDKEENDELIAPCSCKSYVHRSCLDTFRTSSTTLLAMTHCSVCKDAFEYETVPEPRPYCCEWQALFCCELLGKLVVFLCSIAFTALVMYLIDSMDNDIEIAGLLPAGVPNYLAYLFFSFVFTVMLIGMAAIFTSFCDGVSMRSSPIDCSCIILDSEAMENMIALFCFLGILLALCTGLLVMLNMITATANVTTMKMYNRRRRVVIASEKRVKNLRPLGQA